MRIEWKRKHKAEGGRWATFRPSVSPVRSTAEIKYATAGDST